MILSPITYSPVFKYLSIFFLPNKNLLNKKDLKTKKHIQATLDSQDGLSNPIEMQEIK